MPFNLRYATKIRNILIAQGTKGIGHHALHQKTRTPNYKSDDLRGLLRTWQERGWVDKYTIRPESTRPITVWRATELLLTEWKDAMEQVEAVVGFADNQER